MKDCIVAVVRATLKQQPKEIEYPFCYGETKITHKNKQIDEGKTSANV